MNKYIVLIALSSLIVAQDAPIKKTNLTTPIEESVQATYGYGLYILAGAGALGLILAEIFYKKYKKGELANALSKKLDLHDLQISRQNAGIVIVDNKSGEVAIPGAISTSAFSLSS